MDKSPSPDASPDKLANAVVNKLYYGQIDLTNAITPKGVNFEVTPQYNDLVIKYNKPTQSLTINGVPKVSGNRQLHISGNSVLYPGHHFDFNYTLPVLDQNNLCNYTQPVYADPQKLQTFTKDWRRVLPDATFNQSYSYIITDIKKELEIDPKDITRVKLFSNYPDFKLDDLNLNVKLLPNRKDLEIYGVPKVVGNFVFKIGFSLNKKNEDFDTKRFILFINPTNKAACQQH